MERPFWCTLDENDSFTYYVYITYMLLRFLYIFKEHTMHFSRIILSTSLKKQSKDTLNIQQIHTKYFHIVGVPKKVSIKKNF